MPIAILLRSTSGTSVVATEHVARLADLVENLVGCDPHEIGIHGTRIIGPEAPVHGEPAGKAGERILGDGRAEAPGRGRPAREAARGAVDAALQACGCPRP